MKVNVEKSSSYNRVLTIEVPAETVNAEIENIYSRIQKTATHPGFRKGRVPRKILEKKHGKSIRLEAIEATVSSSLKKALEEEKLVPLTDPDLGDMKFDDEGPLSFTVTIEVEPEVELGEYRGIELKRPKVDVKDEDVQRVLERLQLNNAKYIPSERPIEKGDFTLIDFEGFKDGEPVKGLKGENFAVEVGSAAFGEEFDEQLVGMTKDERKDVTVAYPDDFRAKELAGQSVRFAIQVRDTKLRELPEIDDEFAKDLGEYDSLEELKKHIRESLQKDLEKRVEHFLREQAVQKVTAASNVDLPPKLKARVAANVFEEEVKRLSQSGMDRETITADRDQLAEFAEAEATRQLKVTFVTDEIAKRENLSVSDEELNQSIEEMLQESGEEDARVRSYFNSERVRERYRDQLQVKKILDFIVGNAKIEEVTETEMDAGSGEEPGVPESKEGEG